MSRYLDECAAALRMYIEQATPSVGAACQSPIETGLLQGFIAIHLLNRRFQIEGLRPVSETATDFEVRIFIQHEEAPYRLDFAAHLTGNIGGKDRSAWIAIECDGHQFHERTKDQARRDKERDRTLTKRGYRILRFTGSEIYESAFACAVDLHDLVYKIVEGWEGE